MLVLNGVRAGRVIRGRFLGVRRRKASDEGALLLERDGERVLVRLGERYEHLVVLFESFSSDGPPWTLEIEGDGTSFSYNARQQVRLEGSGQAPRRRPDADDRGRATTEGWIWAYAPGPRSSAGSRSGKWLVFVPASVIDRVWDEYAAVTEQGELGPSSKVSTDPGQPSRVLVVFTKDFDDEEDVRRVLRVLRTTLRVKQALAYKTDEATLGNEYGRGVALYVSPKGSLEMHRQR